MARCSMTSGHSPGVWRSTTTRATAPAAELETWLTWVPQPPLTPDPAAGRYVKKSGLDSSGNNPTVVMDGTFTADAELTATFSGGSVAADDHFTVKGDISNFMDGSTGTDLGWTLDLEKSDTILTKSNFEGDTRGGGEKGEWSGMLYGDATEMYDHDYDEDSPPKRLGPTGIAGEFNGHFTNGPRGWRIRCDARLRRTFPD